MFKTLRDAVILVAVVVLLFLQNWRTALIPLIAVPVAIVGTFAVMAGLGFSLNNLTLFGLVLAIGIVVDDAIVVVEAVEHHIELGLAPREATIRAMQDVSGPVVAIGLVLTAVFVPCAFISGIVGQFFRQFALTIATSTVISAFNSLTLSPALAALLMKPKAEHGKNNEVLPILAYVIAGAFGGWFLVQTPYVAALLKRLPYDYSVDNVTNHTLVSGLGAILGGLIGLICSKPLNKLLAFLFHAFNLGFVRTTRLYTRLVGSILRISVVVIVGYVGLLYLTYVGFGKAPSGFIPAQDKGYLLVNVQLPDSTSVEKTIEVMNRVESIAKTIPGVKHTLAIAGQSILLNANAPNFGAMYVMLDDFHSRVPRGQTGDLLSEKLITKLREEVRDGVVNIYGASRGRPGHRGRVQDDCSRPRRQRPRGAPDDRQRRRRRRRSRSRPHRPFHQLQGQHALALSRHRPHPGPKDGTIHGRSLQYVTGLPGIIIRKRLQ